MQETGNNTSAQSLSIRFSTGGFSFFTEGVSKEFKFTNPDYGFARCRAVCLCESDIWSDYRSVSAEIDDYATSLFPSGVFDESDCKRILSFNYPSLDLNSFDIERQYIEGFDITNIFAVNKNLKSFIMEYFPYAKITHTSTALIEKALKSSRKSGESEVWILITPTSMYMSLAGNGSLMLANRYSISSQTDILYYIGAVFSNYKLSQQSTPLYVCGDTTSINALKDRVANCKAVLL